MAAGKSMDAIALLKDDHRKVEKLFKDFESAKGDGRMAQDAKAGELPTGPQGPIGRVGMIRPPRCPCPRSL